jgi:hypothetical protein
MRELVPDQPQEQGGNQIKGVDDEGERVAEHGLVSIDKKEGPDCSEPLDE